VKRIAILTAAVLLAGCGPAKFTSAQQEQIADIAADIADSSVAESAKVAELEGRISELESQVEDLTSRLGELEK
jgi:polyhydroxyalkanoate synthesis regulator phasin